MLTITFVNVTGDTDVADYDARVFVNGTLIHEQRITHHIRAAGWKALVLRLADQELTDAAEQLAAQAKLMRHATKATP